MVRTDIAVEAGLHQRFDHFVDVQAAAAGQVGALFKAAVLHDLHVADVHEADAAHGGVFAHHGGDVVGLGAAQRTGAQAQGVGGAVHQFQEAVQIGLAGDDAGQAEDGIGRIVRMNGHDHAALLGHGDDLFQEFLQVFPQALFPDLAVSADQLTHFVLGVAGVPAGQVDVVLQGVQALHLIPVHDQAGGAVRRLFVQLGTGPVKHGHEVVGHAFDAVFGAAADVLAVDFQQLVHIVAAQLDVLVHGDGFHHVEHKAVVLALLFHFGKALLGPYLTGFYVVHSADNAVHAGDLTDVLQADGVGFAVPAERHFHRQNLLFFE